MMCCVVMKVDVTGIMQRLGGYKDCYVNGYYDRGFYNVKCGVIAIPL